MKNKLIYMLIGLALVVASCKDEPDNPVPQSTDYSGLKFTGTGTLTIPISHVFNTSSEANFELNKFYINALGDSVKVTELSYYFTNVSLLNQNNQWVNLGNYDLIEFNNPASTEISLTNVPAGTYSKIKFLVGVDSLANSTGAHEGELSPAFGMYWSWATGYVFFRMKGRCSGNRSLTFDIGGDKNLPSVELPLSGYKQSGNAIKVNMVFNVADLFVTPYNYDVDTMSIDIHDANNAGIPFLKANLMDGAFTIKSVQ